MEKEKKKVINLPVTDAKLAEKTGISAKTIATRRREAHKMPSQKHCLTGDGKFFFEEGFADYMAYYRSPAWKKEQAQLEKMKIKEA
ncbi:hypothetical protein K6V78_02070 [Streptococcus gallolyticus]|uniref:hypothetical protein n=1 Tax=Streptococcus hepaticus TaxID=3349163 RepID=UPI001C97775A|nr:hypothetical protein [Streptococcus gallolyticus]MBY5040425.1 hypothetical protein [Streptococcus gallolyticus]